MKSIGRTALVTGGGTGLGRGIATELARTGTRIVVASRKPENLAAGVAAVEEVGGEADSFALDVRDPDAVQAAVAFAVERFGSLDIVVNNAAGNFVCPAEDYTPNGWRAIVDIVLNGTFFCSWAAARHWLAAGTPGSIVNIVSTHHETGCPGLAASASSKAGVVTLTKTLAVEWAHAGIRVNAVAPGVFPNPTVQAQMHPEEPLTSAQERAARTVPLGRAGEPWEIGRAVVWLCSENASYVTGHTLVVDGGNWLRRGHLMPEYQTVQQQMVDRGLR